MGGSVQIWYLKYFKVTCVYRTELKMREHVHPEKFKFPLNEPLPTHESIL